MLAQKNPKIGKAADILREISADEHIRLLSEDREKARRDYVSRMDGALAKGMSLGMTKGREEGRAQESMLIARKLLGMKMPIDDIVAAAGLPREKVEGLAARGD